LSSLFPIFGDDGKPRGIGGVTVDVTPRKRAEEEVRKLNEDLERRVEERTAELRREVAERKRAEEELRESEERFRIIFEETMTATTFGKPPGRMHMVNRVMREMFGYSEQELLNISILDIIHPDYRHLTRSREERSLASSGRPYQIEKRYVRKDGESVWAHLNVTPICDAEGKTTHFIRQYHDITERKRAEEALRDLSRRNELILETAGDGIYGVDLGGKATFVNPAAAGMVGWAAEDLVGRPLHELLHHTKPDGNRYPPTECPIYAAFKDGQVHHVTDEVFWRKDGASFPVEYTSTPIYEDDEITGAVVVFRDVTEKRRMQAQLIQSSKLATLGEMATGVAHELNQPLNVVRLAAHNILRKVGKGKADAKYLTGKLETITAQTERAASIIDHMRIFGRPASAAPAPLDPRKMVESTLGLIGKQLERSGIAVGTELPDTCSLVLGHQVQVEQVLLNLVVNARDAVEAHRAEGKREIEIRVVEMAEDSTVEIVVRDNGGGIEPKVLDRIFEPFFTTKEVGQGTGLGLSISYGIVNEMGGRIAAANTEDGTEFTITLPIAAPKAKTA
jgi:PAS domain S-box-containing protein